MEHLKKTLEELASIPGVTGFEDRLAERIVDIMKPLVDDIRRDTLGNVIAVKKGKGKGRQKLLLEAHFDQIGLVITKIEKNGILRFSRVGGINPKTLYGKRVKVFGKKEIWGVIGTKPPHLMSEEEANKIEPLSAMFIDCGYDGAEIAGLVSPGDIALFDFPLFSGIGGTFCSAGLDNKAGACVLIETARLLDGIAPYHDLYFCFSVQEEIGLKGARVAAFSIEPDFAIACDVTIGDAVGNPLKISMAKGPAISVGPGHYPRLVKKLKSICDRDDIPFQIEIEPRPVGTDAAALQISRKGVYTALIGIPLKYMHSQVEMISLRDVYRAARALSGLSREESLYEEEEKGNESKA